MQFVLPFPGRLPDSTLTETAGQREAVTSWRRGDICVMAGPGSGKTRVLVERFRWLVAEKGVDPKSILAITFTEKAANNMRERLVNSTDDVATRQAFERAPISTIHAFCAQLIREHALEIGLDPEFSVMEEWEFALERRRVIEEVLEQMYSDEPAATEQFLRSFPGLNVHGTIESIHESMRASDGTSFAERLASDARDSDFMWHLDEARRLISLPELEEFAGGWSKAGLSARKQLALLDELARFVEGLTGMGPGREALNSLRQSALPRQRAALVDSIHHPSREWLAAAVRLVEESYSSWKHSVSKVDFNDLERFAVRLLEDAPERRERFSHVLVDEFQDTNAVQSKLIGLLRPGGGQAAGGVGVAGQGGREWLTPSLRSGLRRRLGRGWCIGRKRVRRWCAVCGWRH